MAISAKQRKDLLVVLADSPDGVYGVDLDHRIVLWNEAAKDLLGWAAEEVLGKRCYEVLGGRSPDRTECAPDCPAILAARHHRTPSAQTVCVHTKDGTAKWLYIAHVLVPASRPELTVLAHIMRDATNEMEARELLSRLSQFFSYSSPSGAWRDHSRPEDTDRAEELTGREREVLRLLAQGFSTEAIATRLYISPTTVRNYIQRILAKLDVHTRVEAVSYAFRYGLI